MPPELRLVGLLALLPLVAQAENDECDGFGELTGTDALVDGDIVVSMPQRNGHFGYSVARVGDIDGDGFEDVAVGAPGAKFNGPGSGAVFVYFGPFDGTGSFSATNADVVFVGPGPGAHLGTSVAGVGDVDGDGRGDLLLGSEPEQFTTAANVVPEGFTFLVHGDTSFPLMVDTLDIAAATIIGTQPGGEFGRSVSAAGDMNGDGFADFVVGAPRMDLYGDSSGAAYVFYGPVSGSLTSADADRILVGSDPGGRAGVSVALLGDIDGDGFDDIGVGAPRDNTNGAKAGGMFVVHGGDSHYGAYDLPDGTVGENLAESGIAIRGRDYDRFGYAIAPAGDVNADGLADFWVSAHQWAGQKRGAIYLFHGGSDLYGDRTADFTYDVRIKGINANDVLGSDIAGDVDFNADGILDVLVGGERADGDELGSGAAYVVHGPFETDMTVGEFVVRGESEFDYAGSALAAFDVNNDGFDDAVVGAWRADTVKLNAGRVSIFMGGTDLVDLAQWYWDGDGDGWGTDATTAWACYPEDGWVYRGGDCDDADTAYHPYAIERDCSDPNDYNCDGSVGTQDLDGDGYQSCQGDCNDQAWSVYPNTDEKCFDDIDNNCDGAVDDGTAVDATDFFPDFDGDGFGNEDLPARACEQPAWLLGNVVHVGDDCDDFSAATFPGAPEYCDSIDNNCDDVVDEDSAIDAIPWFADQDGDGRGNVRLRLDACSAPDGYVADHRDCDDADASVQPGAIEICNFVDDDCDGFAYHGGPEVIDDPIGQFWGRTRVTASAPRSSSCPT